MMRIKLKYENVEFEIESHAFRKCNPLATTEGYSSESSNEVLLKTVSHIFDEVKNLKENTND